MKPFAVVDIGTNSIRLGVVQPEADHTYTILSQHNAVVTAPLLTQGLTVRLSDHSPCVVDLPLEEPPGPAD